MLIENPLRTWWKVRKWFKFPKPSICFYKDFSASKLIEFYCWDVTWTEKEYQNIRLDFSPYIELTLFKRFSWKLTFKVPEDYVYWETIIEIVYYNKSIKEAIQDNTWKKYPKGIEQDINVFTLNYLTPAGEKLYLYGQ